MSTCNPLLLRSHRAGTWRRRSTRKKRTTDGRRIFGPWESHSSSACSEDTLGMRPSQNLFGPCKWVLLGSEISTVHTKKKKIACLSYTSKLVRVAKYVDENYVIGCCCQRIFPRKGVIFSGATSSTYKLTMAFGSLTAASNPASDARQEVLSYDMYELGEIFIHMHGRC